jgi:hypothetical protein
MVRLGETKINGIAAIKIAALRIDEPFPHGGHKAASPSLRDEGLTDILRCPSQEMP